MYVYSANRKTNYKFFFHFVYLVSVSIIGRADIIAEAKIGAYPKDLGMTSNAPCTRFSDNYELKEELGK